MKAYYVESRRYSIGGRVCLTLLPFPLNFALHVFTFRIPPYERR